MARTIPEVWAKKSATFRKARRFYPILMIQTYFILPEIQQQQQQMILSLSKNSKQTPERGLNERKNFL